MSYTKTFTPQYEDGWQDRPDTSTPVIADALNGYDEALEHIEDYLYNNPIPSTIPGGNYVLKDGDTMTGELVIDNSAGSPSSHPPFTVGERGSGTKGSYTASFGNGNVVSGEMSVAIGASNTVSGQLSLAVGASNSVSGTYAGSIGTNCQSTANGAFSVGNNCIASNIGASAIGNTNTASNTGSSVNGGYNNTSSGLNSSVIGGSGNTSSGQCSVSGGYGSTADGYGTVAIGYEAEALSDYSVATGNNVSIGRTAHCSQAHGYNLVSNYENQFVIGTNNANSDLNIFEVGMSQGSYRGNAFEVRRTGDIVANGDVVDGNGTTIAYLLSLIQALDQRVSALET